MSKYTELFDDEMRDELRVWAEGGCECDDIYEDYDDWLHVSVEDRCQPCMCEVALIASDQAEELAAENETLKARQNPTFFTTDSYAEELRSAYRELLLIINQDIPGMDIADELNRCVSHQQSVEGDPLTVRLEKIRTYAKQQSQAYGGTHRGRVLRTITEMAGGEE